MVRDIKNSFGELDQKRLLVKLKHNDNWEVQINGVSLYPKPLVYSAFCAAAAKFLFVGHQ